MSETHYNGGQGGWDFTYEVVPGSGLVIRKVSHANYRLARDMRVVAVWVAAGDPNDSANPSALRKLRLGDPNTPPIGDPNAPAKEMNVPLLPRDFGFYRSLFGVRAAFAHIEARPGSDLVMITQHYQFGDYGTNPPHEPGGLVQAARVLPLVSFRCSEGINYIRIDYRFHYELGSYIPDWSISSPVPASNQAGVFRDRERLSAGAFPVPHEGDIFQAGEKPVRYEIVGPGLVRGQSIINGVPGTWDNIHQWNAKSSGDLPATPGAFYAVHTHWRWGHVYGQPPSTAFPGSGQQFQGLRWTTSGLGGPLVDRDIPIQNLTFAITADSDPSEEPALDVSTPSFKDFFLNKNTPNAPKDISAGANLIQWFCVEVFRNPHESDGVWENTVFIHGLFFAHNPDPVVKLTSPLSSENIYLLGANFGHWAEPLYQPKQPTQVWERGPS
jgi:hypothetical protein